MAAQIFRNSLLALLLAVGMATPAFAQSFLRASGTKIVNASNQEVILNGVNLGNWALQESYLTKEGWPGFNGNQTQGGIKKALYANGMSDAAVESFYQSYRDKFITKADIDFIASKGFNCVRLPMHYELFLTAAQRAERNNVLHGTKTYEQYVGSLDYWYTNNQLFTDPNNLEGIRMIDNLLGWCAANNMYVILDLHAAPGSQGTDVNITDGLTTLDFWKRTLLQNITKRLWTTVSTRYRNDARVAMYDLINEPNFKTSADPYVLDNYQIRNVYTDLIAAVRNNQDNHLLLLEGNQAGNDYVHITPTEFPGATNLVYNSHRYSGDTYPLDNNVTSTNSGNYSSLRTIGNLTKFRTDYNVPIWVGETGENTNTWMTDAARALNSVGIGWCHWTYKSYLTANNAMLVRPNSPYIPDGQAGLAQVLTNIQFANCNINTTTVGAISPKVLNLNNYPGGGNYYGASPAGRVYEITAKSSGKALDMAGASQANGGQLTQWAWGGGANQKWKLVDVGNGYVRIVNVNSNKSLDVAGPSTADGALIHQWDWLTTNSQFWQLLPNGDGTFRVVNQYSGKVLDVDNNSLADGANIHQWTYGGGNNQRWWFTDLGAARGALATSSPQPASRDFYPNPVTSTLTYTLPAGTAGHQLSVYDAAGRQVLTRNYGSTGEQNIIDLAALRSGLYVVRLTGAGLNAHFTISKE